MKADRLKTGISLASLKTAFVPALRVRFNILLVKIGIRHILPREAVNRIHIAECQEELVRWRGEIVRSGVAARLNDAEKRLPEGYSIKLLEGWRGETEQSAIRAAAKEAVLAQNPSLSGEALDRAIARFAAGESGHRTGGAVDVRLLFHGEPVPCGSEYLEFGPDTASFSRIAPEAARNRALLHRAMKGAGFANYPAEWWHFSYGDRLWAAYRGKRRAIYGATNLSAIALNMAGKI